MIRALALCAGLAAGSAGFAQPVQEPGVQAAAPGEAGANPSASVVLVRGEVGQGHWSSGSGVVIAPGVVASNAHVVQYAGAITVRKDGRSWPAILLCLDGPRDLALLKVAGLPLPPAEVGGADDFHEGVAVASIGFPGGGALHRRGTLTAVWAYRGSFLLQTDAPVAPGSSGGGLFNAEGRLLGITTFALPIGPRFNFAIPAPWALELLAKGQSTPLPGRDSLLRTFIADMSADPANAARWAAFTRAWAQASPDDPEAWFARGHALDQQLREQAAVGTVEPGTLAEGLKASRRALELRPEHAKAWNNLGVALDLANDFPAAESAFLQALALDPDYGLAWLNLGANRINQRNWAGAVAAYARGLERHPDEGPAWARRAFAESMLGRWRDAATHFRIALRYAPANVDLWKDLRQACLKIGDAAGARQAQERIAAGR